MRRCFYHTDLGQQYFTILKYKLHSFNIQEDRGTRGLLAKPLKKISKITYTASRLRAVDCFLKNLSCLFFIKWFYNDV